jgi:D-glycero-alpha-D-manno-heptose 1-phosphate guanylyltransferase
MIKEAIVLAGGLGTRLRKVVKHVPKPMADIDGRPFLEFILSYLHRGGLRKVILAVGYKHEVVRSCFGDKFGDMHLEYSIEEQPLGTGGGIKKGLHLVEQQDAFVLNGDTFFNVKLDLFYRLHRSKGAQVSLALKPMENPSRYGTVEISKDNRIRNFTEKQHTRAGLINGGIYIIGKNIFDAIEVPEAFSFEKNFLEKYHHMLPAYGFPFDDFLIDIGLPQDYEKMKKEKNMLCRE